MNGYRPDKTFSSIRSYCEREPLKVILALAVLFRFLAAVFARGWGMFDDHFVVIESAQSWVDGFDYNDWLPGSPANHGPTGHNFFYPGINFLFFSLMKLLHIGNPQIKMLIMRFLLAAWSVITVYCGYRITETLGGKKPAMLAGMLLAVFWFMPWLSVRNLVEMICVPFIILGYWFVIRPRAADRPLSSWFLSGLMMGLATDIRLQVVFFPLGLGIWLLSGGRFKKLFAFSAGAFLTFALFEGGIDLFIWGKPFIEIYSYTTGCLRDIDNYISLPWYNYFLVLAGMLIPPLSLFLFWGFIRKWKQYLFIFLPVLLFFVFHSYLSNKQERFIVPMIPLFIIAGSLGWNEFRERSAFWGKHQSLLQACRVFFIVINSAALLTLTFTYSKRSLAESMVYLSRYPGIHHLTAVDEDNNPEMFPKFYLGQWPRMGNDKAGDHSLDSILISSLRKGYVPRFVLFTGEQKNIGLLVSRTRHYLPFLVYETTIEPGFIDRFVRWLNPINRNKTVYIYRNAEYYPARKE